MIAGVRNYILVTGAYWGFTLTDGALRMLVLLHFFNLGYSPVKLAFLFLFYEFFGIVTNLLGGWIASQLGLRFTLLAGLFLQVVSLGSLALLNPAWPEGVSVAYVMATQALSGIAKDLTKMSSKSAIKVLVSEDAKGALFRWVAILTGSKNALKGAGFFLGGFLLSVTGYKGALYIMAGGLLVVWLGSWLSLPPEMGRAKSKVKFSQLFSKTREINVLSAARMFLFGARDIWFVVGVPIFLRGTLGWSFSQVGTFMALWVIGYGIVQSAAPAFFRGKSPSGSTAAMLAFVLTAVAAAIPVSLFAGIAAQTVIIAGLTVFGVVFALELSRAFVFGLRLHRRRQGRTERRLLLHGQRRRSPRRMSAVGSAVSSCRPVWLPVGHRGVCVTRCGHCLGIAATRVAPGAAGFPKLAATYKQVTNLSRSYTSLRPEVIHGPMVG